MARSLLCTVVLLCSGIAIATAPTGAAQAQTRPEAPKSLLARVAPSPTGRNGYEELLRAADLVESSRVWKRVEQQGDLATLAVKRRVLHERQLAETRKPRWERSYSDPRQHHDASPSGWVVKSLAPAMNRVDDAYGREEAHVRVLACHAAIRRYRWEHGKLPGGLAELRLGELAIDPFTGQPLQYEVKGIRYRLASVGALADADDPNAVNGRRPVTITPD